jgi:DNA-binding CsgD family transcriptional regulator
MSNIPMARFYLQAALLLHKDIPPETQDSIRRALAHMERRPPARRAPNQSQPLTPALKKVLKRVAEQHADMTIADIAANFDVNPGRVSEAINGG